MFIIIETPMLNRNCTKPPCVIHFMGYFSWGTLEIMKECGEKLEWKFLLVLPVLISVFFHGARLYVLEN